MQSVVGAHEASLPSEVAGDLDAGHGRGDGQQTPMDRCEGLIERPVARQTRVRAPTPQPDAGDVHAVVDPVDVDTAHRQGAVVGEGQRRLVAEGADHGSGAQVMAIPRLGLPPSLALDERIAADPHQVARTDGPLDIATTRPAPVQIGAAGGATTRVERGPDDRMHAHIVTGIVVGAAEFSTARRPRQARSEPVGVGVTWLSPSGQPGDINAAR